MDYYFFASGALLDFNWTKVDRGLCWQDETPLTSTADGWLHCPSCGRSYRPSPDRAERIPIPEHMRGRRFPHSRSGRWLLASGELVPADGDTCPATAVAMEFDFAALRSA